MASVGWSTLDVIPSVKNLAGELDKQTRGDFAAAGRRGGKQLGEAAGVEAAKGFKARFGNVARDALAPAAGILAGAGLIEGFRSVIDAGSDAQQSIGGVQAVFKDYADSVIADSKRAEQGLGLSVTAYQELVTVSGALLKNKGLADFADQAKSLIQIGADLAAQYGGSTRDAVEALNAALRGESDPIERYAISLNETAVNAVLAANGQKTLTGAALEQAKTQARLTLITQQSADAQGAFAREADTQAGAAARASAQWANMRAELGEHLLPVTQAFTGFLNSSALPALEATGGAAGDAVQFFGGLPAPIKAATAALVAFRAAQALGAGGLLSGGSSILSRGLDDVRLRAMALSDEYKRLRQGQLDIIQGSGKFTPAAGRMASALGALEVAAIGAGRGITRGLRSAVGLVGGPWGAAFIAGTAVVAHFWSEHAKAKAHVDDLTAALNQQTGALTENNKQLVIKALQDSDAFKDAKKLGISLELVTNAALGQSDAVRQLDSVLDGLALAQARAYQESGRGSNIDLQRAQTIENLRDAVGGESDKVKKSVQDWRDQAEAKGQSAEADQKATRSIDDYTTSLKDARKAVQDLLDKENERRNKNLGAFQDQTQLAQALADANKEAKEGKKTLDASSEAGRKNRDALAGLADAWNSAADKVKNAKGAYRDMRENFIQVAEKMGASETQAKKLADRLLGIPKNTPAKVTTPGMDAAIAKVRELRQELRGAQNLSRIIISAQASHVQADLADIRGHAHGDLITGPGSGTSDSFLIRASNGEFMQRKKAVDYYGVNFMRKINSLQFPRYAEGGGVGAQGQRSGGVSFAGSMVHIENMTPANYAEFARYVQAQAQAAQRMAALGGIPSGAS